MKAETIPSNFLDIDCKKVTDEICQRLVAVLTEIHKRGLVVAVSGGVDSAVCAALAVKAVGAGKVFGLLLPERDSSSASENLGRQLTEQLGIEYLKQNIAPALDAIECYRWRDDAIRAVIPDYQAHWKSKLVISKGQEGGFSFFKIIVQRDDGSLIEQRLPHKQYLQLVAATNYKQRIRKTIEYFHADRLNYAVIGTPNRLEYDQGFFVKNGDGSADIKPIAHLYKTQVYALARYLGLPQAICQALPTTDTYSLPQGQDEFYFTLPYQQMDSALWAYNHDLSAQALAAHLDINETAAASIYRDIELKRRSTRYLHARPYLMEQVNIETQASTVRGSDK
ncbi:MAG: NAD(+) synthase [Gammaproteobacteria bacterium]|nr:NAD(+) synthase [Gammaproteobacteria bacterium]